MDWYKLLSYWHMFSTCSYPLCCWAAAKTQTPEQDSWGWTMLDTADRQSGQQQLPQSCCCCCCPTWPAVYDRNIFLLMPRPWTVVICGFLAAWRLLAKVIELPLVINQWQAKRRNTRWQMKRLKSAYVCGVYLIYHKYWRIYFYACSSLDLHRLLTQPCSESSGQSDNQH